MSEMYRPGRDLLMGPITGIRPTDDRWGGEVPEEYMLAIFDDVVNGDLPTILQEIPEDAPIESVLGMAVMQTIVRTAQRLAVELDGCTIDTTTIFEDDVDVS